jgi:hypothetical protein
MDAKLDGDGEQVANQLSPQALREKKLAQARTNIAENLYLLSRPEHIHSAVYLWRRFFEHFDQVTGSAPGTIELLVELKEEDAQIYQWLMAAEFSSQEIAQRLSYWPDGRIINAVFMAHEALPGQNTEGTADADDDILFFVFTCGWSDERIVAALHHLDCFTPKAMCCFDEFDWGKSRIFSALLKSSCFDDRVYCMLRGLKIPTKQGLGEKPLWTNDDFFQLMDNLGISDGWKVAILRQVGASLAEICLAFTALGRTKIQVLESCCGCGFRPGEVVAAFVILACKKLPPNKRDRRDTRALVPLDLTKISSAEKSEVINLLKLLPLTASQVVWELAKEDWPYFVIVDYLLVSGLKPREIITAMLQSGITEYHLSQMIKRQLREFGLKVNTYWSPVQAQEWKRILFELANQADN